MVEGMADEREVLQHLRQLLIQPDEDQNMYLWVRLASRWLEESLPLEPAGGRLGQRQLIAAAGFLDEVAVEARSLSYMGTVFPDGIAFVDFAGLADAGEVARRRVDAASVSEEAIGWALRLEAAAATIRSFVGPDGNDLN